MLVYIDTENEQALSLTEAGLVFPLNLSIYNLGRAMLPAGAHAEIVNEAVADFTSGKYPDLGVFDIDAKLEASELHGIPEEYVGRTFREIFETLGYEGV